MDWLQRRIREPSTWGGLAMVIFGGSNLADFDEGQQIGEAVAGIGQAVAGGMEPVAAAMLGLGGLVSVFLGEKGRR